VSSSEVTRMIYESAMRACGRVEERLTAGEVTEENRYGLQALILLNYALEADEAGQSDLGDLLNERAVTTARHWRAMREAAEVAVPDDLSGLGDPE
jgi:hypothetical protein